MPSGNIVFPLFGGLAALLSPFFTPWNFNGLAHASPAPAPYIVVLDPGHGGNDHGASAAQVSEKEISLGIAIRTMRLLRDPEFGGTLLDRPIKVILTRDRDEYVSLEKRAEIAKSNHADLFVSIHSNSDPAGKAEGLETFFLNNTDQASDSKLEQIENRTTERYKGPKKANSLLMRTVAADAVTDLSKEAAGTVHESLAQHLRSREVAFHDRGVRQGLLYVLLDSQSPALLLEAFFLSHKADRKLLTETEGRQRIAEGLAKGILRYLALH
jgi:N-acetylmuramoyl-L-alanine amidase